MKQKQFYFIYVFLLSMTFLGACSKDSPNELIPNTIVKIEIDKLPGKRIYFIGEELDVSDMTLKVFYSNETSEIVPVKKDEITGFNNTVPENDQILEVHKGKVQRKTEKSAGTGKKETEHSGVSGDQRFFQGYES